MSDFDKTNYEDYLLSNFREQKNVGNEVPVEILVDDFAENACKNETNAIDCENTDDAVVEIDNNKHFVEIECSLKKDDLLTENNSVSSVQGKLIDKKGNRFDSVEPRTLSVVLKGIEENKSLKDNYSAVKSKKTCRNKHHLSKKSKGRKFAIAILSLIVAFVSCLLIADSLSGGYIIDSAMKALFNDDTSVRYYAVEIANFTDVDSARITSEEIRASGGSGYVIHDKLYRVIAEVYKEIKQAESVSAKLNLSGYVTSVYEINIGEINYGLFPTSTRNLTKDIMKYQELMYDTLYNVAQNLENEVIDFATARSEVKNLKNQINNMLIEYESNVDSKIDNKYVVKVRMQIVSMIGALDNITNDTSKNERLLSDIRYINTMIINTHRALVNSLQKVEKI